MRWLMAVVGGLAALAAQSASSAAQEQPEPRPSIVVVGVGTASAPPDSFEVDATIRGRGTTQQEALRSLAGAQARMVEAWPKLQGLSRSEVNTGRIVLDAVYDQDCAEKAREPDDCPVTSWYASSQLSLRGAPADSAGNAIALASELGATSARLEEFGLTNPEALRVEAGRAAFADAQRQAERLAAASGRRLVRILRIQDPSAPRQGEDGWDVQEIVVTGSRIRPPVTITVAPEPIEASARVFVTYEID